MEKSESKMVEVLALVKGDPFFVEKVANKKGAEYKFVKTNEKFYETYCYLKMDYSGLVNWLSEDCSMDLLKNDHVFPNGTLLWYSDK